MIDKSMIFLIFFNDFPRMHDQANKHDQASKASKPCGTGTGPGRGPG